MLETAEKRDSDLPDFLATRARASSDTRLAANAAGGFIVALVSIAWPYPFWYIGLAAAGCFLSFGVWGIADRELAERSGTASPALRRALRAARVLASVVGGASAAVLAVSVLALAIGRVIS